VAIAQAACDMAAALPGVVGSAFVDWSDDLVRCLATGGRIPADVTFDRAWLTAPGGDAQSAEPVVGLRSGVMAIPVGRAAPTAALVVRFAEAQPADDIERALRHMADLAYVALCGQRRSTVPDADHKDGLETLAPSQREQFRRTERLASIGVLAAGIAHELNNPLGAIMLEAETALMSAKRGEPQPLLLDSLDGIRQNVERCAQIVQGVLRFAKRQPETHGPCDLVSVLQSARDYSRELCVQRSVRIDFAAAPHNALVEGNRLGLEQVFVNLFHNAIQASPRGGTVEVRIQLGPSEIGVSVADQGGGIAPADLPRLFEPFFTTRIQEAGTGLGLSIVQGIVADHHGRVEVSSQLRHGAIFTVFLPRMLEP